MQVPPASRASGSSNSDLCRVGGIPVPIQFLQHAIEGIARHTQPEYIGAFETEIEMSLLLKAEFGLVVNERPDALGLWMRSGIGVAHAQQIVAKKLATRFPKLSVCARQACIANFPLDQKEFLEALHQTALDLLARREIPDLLQAIVDRCAALLDA